MADIYHTLFIKAPITEVFFAVSSPVGLDLWWTDHSSGNPGKGESYSLNFTDDYQWGALVEEWDNNALITYRITLADDDWLDTEVSFRLSHSENKVRLDFEHRGWKKQNDHFRISSYCWANYLRILKRNLELGEFVPYDERNLV